MEPQVRRIVLGAGADGAVGVWFDGPSPHVQGVPGYPPELALVDLWYTADTAAAPGVDTADRPVAIAPDPGGTLFRVVQFPPDTALPLDDDGKPSLFWHETATTDYNVLLTGELALVYDGGEVVLQVGDTMVVHGGRHAWSNCGTANAMLATVAVADPATAQTMDAARIDELMTIAIDEARAALAHDDVPIGAVVARIDTGEVIARRHNEREQAADPTAHAEVLALRDAAEALGHWRLDECALIVTLEPCPMCAGAALNARIGIVAFGAADPKAGAVGSLYNLAVDPRLNHEMTVIAGVQAEASGMLLREFFAGRR